MRAVLADHFSRHWRFAPVAASIVIPSAFAWAVIIAVAFGSSPEDLCFALSASALDGGMLDVWMALRTESVARTAILMAAAMTLPLAWRPALCVYSRSFRDDAWLLSATLAAVFAAAWASFLLPISVAGALANAAVSSLVWPGAAGIAAAAAAALWRLTNWADAALRSCHRTEPIRAFAPGCYLDSVGYGWRSALACCRACAPAMLVPFFCSNPPLAMAGVSAIAFSDRFTFRPSARLSAAGYLAVGLLANW
jgi:hypothetical protein